MTSAQFLWTDAHPLKLTLLLTVSVTEPRTDSKGLMLCCLCSLLIEFSPSEAYPGRLQEIIELKAFIYLFFLAQEGTFVGEA